MQLQENAIFFSDHFFRFSLTVHWMHFNRENTSIEL